MVEVENERLGLVPAFEEFLHEFIPLYGWPRWPPEQVPQSSEWWQEEIYVLPDFAKRRSLLPPMQRMQAATLVEVNSLPQAGWSTMIPKVSQAVESMCEKKNWASNIWDEVIYTYHDGEKHTLSTIYALPLPVDCLDDDLSITSYGAEDSWFMVIDSRNAKSFLRQARVQSYGLSQDEPKHTFFIETRGACDDTIWFHAHAAHRKDPSFSFPESIKDALGLHLVPIQLQTTYTDAVILTGISHQEAQKRRQGKDYPGWIADSPFFTDLSAWYGYWIKQVWPKLFQFKGTGLLVVDGERPEEEKIEIITDYLGQIINFS